LKSKLHGYSIIFILVLLHFWQASRVRPVGDDYTMLRIYSDEGFWSSINQFWMNFGGNLSAIVIRLFFVSFSSSATNWLGFILYSLITSILILISYLILFAWLTSKNLYQLKAKEVILFLAATFIF
jgi:hypothetical protein